MENPRSSRDPFIDHLYEISDQLFERSEIVTRQGVGLSRLLAQLDAKSQKLIRRGKSVSEKEPADETSQTKGD